MDARIPGEPVRIRADGLTLRPFTTADTDALARAFADTDIGLWSPLRGADADLDGWIAYRNDWSSGEHASWAITDSADALVGSISLHHVEYEMRNGEVGYWVAPSARRRGFGIRALRSVLAFGFDTVELHRIELFHAVENDASCAMATQAGFRLEGVLRETYRYGDGEYHDEHMHALLAREWEFGTSLRGAAGQG